MAYYQDSSTGGACKPCAAGTFIGTVGQSGCTNCASGTVAAGKGIYDAGSTASDSTTTNTCTACAAGQYLNTNTKACTNCPAGWYSTGSASATSYTSGCTKCSTATSGQTSTAGTTKCALSDLGKGDCTATNTCVACSAGTYASDPAADGSITCLDCPAGTYSYAGALKCTRCSGYGTSGGGTPGAVGTCQPCDAGKFAQTDPVTGDVTCVACPKGSYSTSTGSTSCTPCPKGWTTDGTGTTAIGADDTAGCKPCGAGNYGTIEVDPTTGQQYAKCNPCAVGTFAAAATTTAGSKPAVDTCSACTAGRTQKLGGTATTADGCAIVCDYAGTYFDPNSGSNGACVACPAGTYNTKPTGAVPTKCQTCNIGR